MPSTRRSAPLLLVVGLALAVGLGPHGAAAEDPEPVVIVEAPALNWGFKQSWRVYTGAPQVAGGAVLTAGSSASDPYGVTWEFDSGSYDASTGTTELRYRGSAHWLKYYVPDSPALGNPPPGYTGPLDVHRLDVKLTDPVVTIGPDSATISVEAVSRELASWQLVDLGRIDVVTLDVAGKAPVVDGGTTTWTGIPAFTGEGADPVFADNYPAGRAVDPLSFSYAGPGGAPDFSEEWDVPGTTKLSLTRNEILTTIGDTNQYSPWWIDRGRRLVHYRSVSTVDEQSFWTYRAFDLDTMAHVGEPLVVPSAERVSQTSLFDTTAGRLFYGQPGETSSARWIRFDAELGQYVRGAPAAPLPLSGSAGSLFWDAAGKRAFNVQRFVPAGVASTAYDLHQWKLHSYTEQADGTWTRESYDLPSFVPGLNRRAYPDGNSTADAPIGVAARDGSLILIGSRRTSDDPVAFPEPATVPGAWRIELTGAQAAISAIPGTEVANSSSATFDTLRPGPDGQVSLFRIGSRSIGVPHIVQRLTVSEEGALEVGPQVDLGDLDISTVDAFAVDPEDGTAWVGGNRMQRLVGVEDDRVVADQFILERHPRGGPVIAGAGHAVHPQTNDGSPAGFGGSPIYGFGRVERLGWSPGVTADPLPGVVELGVGEVSEQAEFRSAGAGTPVPGRQWQVKAPGGLRFVDLEGETGEALRVDAERGMGGNEYRAVYSNAAGRIASEPAVLTVDYAPEIAVDVTDVSAVEGDDAVFQVLSQGSPEPGVVWQRRVGGFWQGIDAADDNFVVDGGLLTVRDTNFDQAGALFRAKVSNSVSTVYSRAAELSVESSSAIPPGGLSLDGVSLDWSGSAELQRNAPNGQPNYFSAGASDGDALTYRAEADGVRVLHVPAGGGTATLGSWGTRGAQTTGAVEQVVQLTDGHAEIAEDGSASVVWDGSFSVNFYGGLVPFTVSGLELAVDADGDGTLTGDLSGYGASQADPGDRHPLAPVADVTVATFSGVEVDPEGEVVIEPDYAGVEVEPPAGFGPQDRVSDGWGGWPQQFVDFHAATGLAPYWYSSGGVFDPHKAADPFTVDFTGAGSVAPLVPPVDEILPPVLPPAQYTGPAAEKASTTTLRLGRGQYGRPTIVAARVTVAGGGAASGAVNVTVAGRTVTGVLDGGVARLRLPTRLRPGTHGVSASYAGTTGVASSNASATLRIAKASPSVAFRVFGTQSARARGVGGRLGGRAAVTRLAGARAVRARGVGARLGGAGAARTRPARSAARTVRLSVVARIPGAVNGVHPTGQLVVRDRGRIVAVRALRPAGKGRATIALPALRPGAHFLRVTLTANSRQNTATTAYRTLQLR